MRQPTLSKFPGFTQNAVDWKILGRDFIAASTPHNNAMHAELAAVPSSLYKIARANRVIANVIRSVAS
jgi:hypothetical protein